MRHGAYLATGGFGVGCARPLIEDIELGYHRGVDFAVAKQVRVTHLKRWILRGILITGIRDRALPWTELIRRSRDLPNDPNLNAASRSSAMSAYAPSDSSCSDHGGRSRGWWPWRPCPSCGHAIMDKYAFFPRERGLHSLLDAMPLYWLRYGYSVLAFAWGMLFGSLPHRRRQPTPRRALGSQTPSSKSHSGRRRMHGPPCDAVQARERPSGGGRSRGLDECLA
jgi:hypothetical protein